jgi:hypothetical protein
LNIGLATASVAINQRAAAALIFGFAILVAKRHPFDPNDLRSTMT